MAYLRYFLSYLLISSDLTKWFKVLSIPGPGWISCSLVRNRRKYPFGDNWLYKGAHPRGGCRHHGLVNRACPPFQHCLRPPQTTSCRAHWCGQWSCKDPDVTVGTWQEDHSRVTGLSPPLSGSIQDTCGLQARKTSSLTLCRPRDRNPGPWGNL